MLERVALNVSGFRQTRHYVVELLPLTGEPRSYTAWALSAGLICVTVEPAIAVSPPIVGKGGQLYVLSVLLFLYR